MKCNINACVGLLCAFTISLHLYLHTHRSEALPPKLPAHGVPRSRRPGTAKRVSWGRTFRSKKARETDRVIGKASMWDRRYAYSPRPPHNATVDDWLPLFAGTCAQSDGELEDDALPQDQNARSLFKSTQNRIRAFELVKNRRRGLTFGGDFRLPDGCAPLHKRTWREAFEADRKKPAGANLDDVTGDDADDDVTGQCAAAACLPNLFLIGASKSGTTTLYEALAAHPRIAPMYPEPHTHGETHVWSPPQGTNIMRGDAENTLRALRRALPLPRQSLARKAPAIGRWRLEDSRDGPYFVIEYTPHYLVLGNVRDKICASLSYGGTECRNARYIAMLRDPAKRAFSQYVMKTHMRIALYNDKRTFWEAVVAGMKHTQRYANCWDTALGLAANESAARDVASTRVEKIGDLASGRCAPINFHGNLFQAYVLKSAYYYQLLPWFAHFPSSVYVDVLERFDDAAVARMVEWLGLPYLGADGYKSSSVVVELTSAKRNVARDGGASALDAEHAATLDDFFRPMNRKLDLLLGRPTGYPV